MRSGFLFIMSTFPDIFEEIIATTDATQEGTIEAFLNFDRADDANQSHKVDSFRVLLALGAYAQLYPPTHFVVGGGHAPLIHAIAEVNSPAELPSMLNNWSGSDNVHIITEKPYAIGDALFTLFDVDSHQGRDFTKFSVFHANLSNDINVFVSPPDYSVQSSLFEKPPLPSDLYKKPIMIPVFGIPLPVRRLKGILSDKLTIATKNKGLPRDQDIVDIYDTLGLIEGCSDIKNKHPNVNLYIIEKLDMIDQAIGGSKSTVALDTLIASSHHGSPSVLASLPLPEKLAYILNQPYATLNKTDKPAILGNGDGKNAPDLTRIKPHKFLESLKLYRGLQAEKFAAIEKQYMRVK